MASEESKVTLPTPHQQLPIQSVVAAARIGYADNLRVAATVASSGK